MHTERVFLAYVYFLLAAHGDTRTGNRCIEGMSGTYTVQLQCSVGERIHVEQEAYGDRDAASCRLKSAQGCSKVHNSNQNGLIVNCNGKQSCREVITATPQTNCNYTDAAAEVIYTCIKVQLQCSDGERIHVEQEAFGDGDAATCRLKYGQSCSKVHNSSQNGLIVNCNGKQSCREVMSASTLTCNFTDAAAEVKYNCIKGSMNMCRPVSTTVNGSVYLHSPGFPGSVGVNGSCVVRITGQNIQVTLVEERMKAGLLNISGDGKQLWTSVNVLQYNRLLPGTAAEIVIVYDNQYKNGSNVWIRVSGQMNITFKGQTLDVSTTPSSTPTQQPSRSQGTTSPSTSDTLTTAATKSTPSTSMDSLTTSIATTLRISNGITTLSERTTKTTAQGSTDTMTSLTSTALSSTHTDNGNIVLPLAVVCGIMGLIIVALIIYIMVNRLSRNSHGNSSNPETSTHYGVQSIPNGPKGEDDLIPTSGTTNTYSGLSHDVERNVYSGIQHHASEDGDEHSYGHINIIERPSYVNSVSGDDPYINA